MLENLQPRQYIAPCAAIERVKKHPDTTEEDVELMRQYLADVENWPARTLMTALKEKGIFMERKVIERHRDGRCPC